MPECLSVAKYWNKIKDTAYIYPNPVIDYYPPTQLQQSLNDNFFWISPICFPSICKTSWKFSVLSVFNSVFIFLLNSISLTFYFHSSPKQLLSGILMTFMLLISMVNSQLTPYKCLIVFDIVDHFHPNRGPFHGYQNITPLTTVTQNTLSRRGRSLHLSFCKSHKKEFS